MFDKDNTSVTIKASDPVEKPEVSIMPLPSVASLNLSPPLSALCVHLGCFDRPASGWHNIDITPHLFIARLPGLATLLYRCGFIDEERFQQHKQGVFSKIHYMDMRRKFPFGDGSVDAYFSSHTLEHLYIYETEMALREIHRTLRPGGYVRFVLPDLDRLIDAYDRRDPTAFLRGVFQSFEPTGKQHQHRWMFTPAYLERLLRAAGFDKIWRREYRQTFYGPFVALDYRPDESFYMEAQKT